MYKWNPFTSNFDEKGDWLFNGNTLGSKKTLGSIDNQDFGIITNNTERLTVLKDGNVGIGITNPSFKLQVNGNAALNENNVYTRRRITTISRAIAAGAGSWINLGSVTTNGQGTYVRIYQSNHHSDSINAAVYEISDVYYAGATTDWMQVPTTDYRSYTGAQDYAIDVRRTVNGGAFEIRARSISASYAGTLQFEIQTNGTFTESSTAGTGATVAGYLGRNVYQFPVSNSRFSVSSNGLFILNSGNIGIGTTNPTAKLDVNSDILRLRTAKTPGTSGASGNQGDIAWDADYIYICTATNTWKRSAIATW